MAVFLIILNRRLNGLPLAEWGSTFLRLLGATSIAGLSGYAVSLGCERLIGSQNLFLLIIQLGLAIIVTIGIFGSIASQMKLPELDILMSRISQKIKRK